MYEVVDIEERDRNLFVVLKEEGRERYFEVYIGELGWLEVLMFDGYDEEGFKVGVRKVLSCKFNLLEKVSVELVGSKFGII